MAVKNDVDVKKYPEKMLAERLPKIILMAKKAKKPINIRPLLEEIICDMERETYIVITK